TGIVSPARLSDQDLKSFFRPMNSVAVARVAAGMLASAAMYSAIACFAFAPPSACASIASVYRSAASVMSANCGFTAAKKAPAPAPAEPKAALSPPAAARAVTSAGPRANALPAMAPSPLMPPSARSMPSAALCASRSAVVASTPRRTISSSRTAMPASCSRPLGLGPLGPRLLCLVVHLEGCGDVLRHGHHLLRRLPGLRRPSPLQQVVVHGGPLASLEVRRHHVHAEAGEEVVVAAVSDRSVQLLVRLEMNDLRVGEPVDDLRRSHPESGGQVVLDY